MGSSSHDHHASVATYAWVAAALIVLTILTVIAAEMDMGVFAAPVAFTIATAKAAFVLLYFMHLKDDTMINRVIFASGFFFLLLLFIFCVLDIFLRVPQTSPL